MIDSRILNVFVFVFLLSGSAFVEADPLDAAGRKACLSVHNQNRRALANGQVQNSKGQMMPKATDMIQMGKSRRGHLKRRIMASDSLRSNFTVLILATLIKKTLSGWWDQVKNLDSTDVQYSMNMFMKFVSHFAQVLTSLNSYLISVQMAYSKNTAVGCARYSTRLGEKAQEITAKRDLRTRPPGDFNAKSIVMFFAVFDPIVSIITFLVCLTGLFANLLIGCVRKQSDSTLHSSSVSSLSSQKNHDDRCCHLAATNREYRTNFSTTSNDPLQPPAHRRRELPHEQIEGGGISWLDLARRTLPIHIFEPLSLLQAISEELRFAGPFLNHLNDQKDPTGRFCSVIGFIVSGYSGLSGRSRKPFNPLLGETFDFISDDKWKYHAEQVTTVIQNPRATAENRLIRNEGEMMISTNTGLEGRIWFTADDQNSLVGTIQRLSDGVVLFHLKGHWDRGIPDGIKWETIFEAPEINENAARFYGFSEFTMDLNCIHESQRPFLPSTDSRLRPDQRHLENGDAQRAEREKKRLEQASYWFDCSLTWSLDATNTQFTLLDPVVRTCDRFVYGTTLVSLLGIEIELLSR
ncbi:hypothetical protein M3Y96_00552800 [Aphelenchoides besseyi]|nr:hypothetical protein M3Y96_00552800 [Aphelenchoides besseyi]